MTKKRKAELCDEVIKKFYGDLTFKWKDLHGPDGFEFNDLVVGSDCDKDANQDTKWYVILPIISVLLQDGILKRKEEDTPNPSLCLTDKGSAKLPFLEHDGYKANLKREKRKTLWVFLSGGIAIATFLVLIYNTWLKQPTVSDQKSDTTTSQTSTPYLPQLDTNKQSAKPDSLNGIDTQTQQLPIQKKQNKKVGNK